MSDEPTLATPVTPAPVEPVRRPGRHGVGSSGRWLNLLLGVAAAVAIGGVAFAVGRSTAPVAAARFGRVPTGQSSAPSTRTLVRPGGPDGAGFSARAA